MARKGVGMGRDRHRQMRRDGSVLRQPASGVPGQVSQSSVLLERREGNSKRKVSESNLTIPLRRSILSIMNPSFPFASSSINIISSINIFTTSLTIPAFTFSCAPPSPGDLRNFPRNDRSLGAANDGLGLAAEGVSNQRTAWGQGLTVSRMPSWMCGR